VSATIPLLAGLVAGGVSGNILAQDQVETWWTQLATALSAFGLGWGLVYLAAREAARHKSRPWLALVSLAVAAASAALGAAAF